MAEKVKLFHNRLDLPFSDFTNQFFSISFFLNQKSFINLGTGCTTSIVMRTNLYNKRVNLSNININLL